MDSVGALKMCKINAELVQKKKLVQGGSLTLAAAGLLSKQRTPFAGEEDYKEKYEKF